MLRRILFAAPALMIASATACAQRLSLDEAVQTALQKNDLVKASGYQIEQYSQLKKTATDIGKTTVNWMHGQYNSIYQDNNFTVLQTIPFPTVLKSQMDLGREEVTGAKKQLQSVQNELVFQVRTAYYQLLYLEALRKLLLSQDSLYSDFTRASSTRYRTGEANLLEKMTAETQGLEIKNQVRLNDADIQIQQTLLQSLLKSEAPVSASAVLDRRRLPSELDSASLAGNPELAVVRQQVVISRFRQKVERGRILPDIGLGYFSQSLIGVQNVDGRDQYFGRGKHFQGFQVGLSIPIWFKPYVAHGRAAAFQAEAAQKKADHFQTSLTGTFSQALQELDKNTSSLNYYESSALQNAGLLLRQAGHAYRGGEIGYLEYLQSVRSALTIRSGYLQSLNAFNQAVVRVEFLLGKF